MGILAGGDNGRVFAFDEHLGVLGSFDLARELKAVSPLEPKGGTPAFILLSEKSLHPINFIDYPLRKSRVH